MHPDGGDEIIEVVDILLGMLDLIIGDLDPRRGLGISTLEIECTHKKFNMPGVRFVPEPRANDPHHPVQDAHALEVARLMAQATFDIALEGSLHRGIIHV